MIVTQISTVLNGNILAAEYITMCLLSRVTSAQRGSTLPGYFGLNVYGFEEDDVRITALQNTLRNIVPRCVTVSSLI